MKNFIFTVMIMVFSVAGFSMNASAQELPTTKVMMLVNAKPEKAGSDEMMAVLPSEVRATMQLYLAGKIDQWFFRKDGGGVVFIMNATSAAEATAAINTLPLTSGGFTNVEAIELGPMAPMGRLLANTQ